MQVIIEIDDFYQLKEKSWSGALQTLQEIEDYDSKNNQYNENMWNLNYKYSNKRKELIELLEDYFYEPTDEVKINDFLWFDRDEILKQLEIPTED